MHNVCIYSTLYNTWKITQKYLSFPEIEWEQLEKVTQAVMVFKTNFIQNGSEWKYKSFYVWIKKNHQ